MADIEFLASAVATPVEPDAPLVARPRRPGPVIVASALLGVVALGVIAWVVLLVEDVTRLDRDVEVVHTRYPDISVGEDGPTFYAFFSYALAMVLIVIAMLLMALAVLTWRGYGAARVATVVVAAISAVLGSAVGGLALLISLLDNPRAEPVDTSSFDAALSQLHSLSSPSWTNWLLAITAFALPLAAVAALVCLVLPASNQFYRGARAARREQRQLASARREIGSRHLLT